MNGPRLASLVFCAGLLAGLAGRASAGANVQMGAGAGAGLDPFQRPARAASHKLDPFRVAAEAAAPTPAPAAPAKAAPKACTTDEECPDETICEQQTCRGVQGTTNILYLYYREGTFREILGLYWSKRGPTGYTVLAPLYWHFWSPKTSSTVLAPLFASSRDGHDGWTWVFPFNFFWHDKTSASQLVIPFYYRHQHAKGGAFLSWFGYTAQNGPDKRGSVLWLYWWGENRKEPSSYDVLFPLIWDFKGPTSRSTVGFPLFWRFREGGSTTTIAGPWLHLDRPTWSFDAGLLLWWAGRDTKAGSAFKLLVPLFYWQTSAHGRRMSWLSPIGGYGRDDEARSKTLTILPLLTFWRRDPARQIHVITPLFIRHHATAEDATTKLISLLLYRRDDPQGTTTALLPVFWHFWDRQTDASATLLLPFFARRAGPRDTSTAVGVGPLFAYWRSFAGGGWSGGLSPLAFFGSNQGRSHAVVFPLFWRFSGGTSSTTVLAPLFYWHRDARGTAGGLPALLTFWGNRAGESYAFQVPLLWHFASERQGTSTTVTPLGYHHRDRDGWSVGVGPLVPLLYARSGAVRSHAVLFPLFWRFSDKEAQRTTTVLGPFWHRSWGGETTDALFPLVHWRRGARPGGTDETSFTLFPLVHYHRDAYTRVLVTPLGASARGPRRQAGFLGPYFWYKDADLDASFIPFLHADVSRKATGERTRQWGPWFQLDGPGRQGRVLFPLFGRYVDAHESDTYVFPSYFRQRRDDGSRIDALVPLFWRSSGPGRATTVIGLWYDHTAPDVHNTGFFPLWFHARNAKRSFTVIPPLLFVRHHDRQADRERLLCLLLWHSREGAKSRTTLFPIWWAARTETSSHQVLFPIFWRFTDSTAEKSWTLAGPLYWASNKTERTRGLLPVAWYSRDPAKGSGSTALLPVFYENHGPQRQTFMSLLFGFKRAPESRFTYAGPGVPLFVSHRNERTETETTIFPPLLYYSRLRPDSRLMTMLGLFWRHRDVVSSTTLLLPLFYDVLDKHLSRTTVLLPLFVRHSDEVHQSVTWVAPFFYRRSAPTSSTTVAFPLYWDFKTGAERRTTLFLPLFARWRRPTHTSTWVFPTIFHRTGLAPGGAPDGTWRTVVAPFYAAAVKRPGDFMWEVLGGLVGHERQGRNRYLKLFFLSFEQEPAPRAQTAWYGKAQPASRRTPVRGLSMNTW